MFARTVMALGCALSVCAIGCVDRTPPRLTEPPRRLLVATVDPVPVGIEALETYLGASVSSGLTAHQRLVATRRLATLLAQVDGSVKGARSGPRAVAALYRNLLRELPTHPDREQILVALGVSLAHGGSIAEAQQIYRAVVCPSRYSYAISLELDAKSAQPAPKPQDHSVAYWHEWMLLHPHPLDRSRTPREASVGAPFARQRPASAAEETSYRPIYGKKCVPQKRGREIDSGLYASLWLAIGDYHASESDPVDGPYAFNRALDAYRHAHSWSKASGARLLLAHALLVQADAHKRAERHQRATALAVRLMLLLDDGRLSPATTKLLRDRAVAIIARSLTFVDFAGPPLADPFVSRPNSLDIESDPQVIEQRLSIGVARVTEQAIVPQDRTWTPALYQALAHEYHWLGNNTRNVLATLRAFLDAFPNHRSAPLVRAGIVQALFELDAQTRLQNQPPSKLVAEAQAEQTKLRAQYGPGSAWARANAGDAEALARAAELVGKRGSAVP